MVARGNETRHDTTGERMSEGEDPRAGEDEGYGGEDVALRALRCLVGWAGGEGGAGPQEPECHNPNPNPSLD